MLFGVTQGPVLGPRLYELANVVARHSLQVHQYADDIHIYAYTTVECTLNLIKTQVMWLGSIQKVVKLDINLMCTFFRRA